MIFSIVFATFLDERCSLFAEGLGFLSIYDKFKEDECARWSWPAARMDQAGIPGILVA